VNREFIKKLIAELETGCKRAKFNMTDWLRKERGCGTVACIAGHAVLMAYPTAVKVTRGDYNIDTAKMHKRFPQVPQHSYSVYSVAMALMGLDDDQANELFSINSFRNTLYIAPEQTHLFDHITVEDAIKALKKVLQKPNRRNTLYRSCESEPFYWSHVIKKLSPEGRALMREEIAWSKLNAPK
jgi:hypothetical protein